MTTSAAETDPTYADWKAPAGDGEMLIWPEPGDLLRQTRENHERLTNCDSVRIQNTPLPTIRRAMREWIGHDSDDRPLLATGHQSELYHAGVWVKDVLLDRAAAKLQGSALHFAVDTDSPKHLNVRWPGQSLPTTDDVSLSTAAWSGLLKPPSGKHLDTIVEAARSDWHRFGYEPMLFPFLESMRRRQGSATAPTSLSALITATEQDLDEQLGLTHRTTIVSPMLQSPGFLAFVHHVLSRPDAFAASYNSALAEYRERTGTTSPMRPMPDLFVSDQSVETPFWLDNLATGTRTRPSVFRGADGFWILELLTGDEFIFQPDIDALDAAERLRMFLEQASHRLSPRALTLTLFLRLLVADQFVHGIGGGRYDQVSDRIIATHFGLAPPRFSVTTGTLYFPTAMQRERVCLPCLLQDGHRLKHAVLGHRKQELVGQIDALPRRSSARSRLFLEMQKERRAAIAESVAVQQWEQSLRDAAMREQEDQVLFDRELFYAVQSRERLTMMIEKYHEALA